MLAFLKDNPKGKKTGIFLKRFIKTWFDKDAIGMSAAISFFAIFALAPIIATCLFFGSKILGEDEADSASKKWLESFLSPEEADNILSFVTNQAFTEHSNNWSLVLASIFFLWISSLLFDRLRFCTNTLLGVKHGSSLSQAIKKYVIGRLQAVILSIFLVALMIGVMVAIVFIEAWGIIKGYGFLGEVIQNFGIALLVAILSFNVIYWLPARKLGPKGMITAISVNVITFIAGKVAISACLKSSDLFSTWGAASALVIVTTWFNYNALTFFLGVTIGGIVDAGLDEESEYYD